MILKRPIAACSGTSSPLGNRLGGHFADAPLGRLPILVLRLVMLGSVRLLDFLAVANILELLPRTDPLQGCSFLPCVPGGWGLGGRGQHALARGCPSI